MVNLESKFQSFHLSQKPNENISVFSAVASKMGQMKKIMAHLIMPFSDYVSSNILICLFLFDPFQRARAEIQKYLCSVFGSNENSKFCFRD